MYRISLNSLRVIINLAHKISERKNKNETKANTITQHYLLSTPLYVHVHRINCKLLFLDMVHPSAIVVMIAQLIFMIATIMLK